MGGDHLSKVARGMVARQLDGAPRGGDPLPAETVSTATTRTITPRSMTLRYKGRLYEVPCDRPDIPDVAAFMRRSREEQGVVLLGRDVFEQIRRERMGFASFDKMLCCLLELHGLLPRARGVRR